MNNAIIVESQVSSRTLTPAVRMTWGKEAAQLGPVQARYHAFSVLEAIAAAEIDACLMQLAVKKLGSTPQDASQILMVFRQKRDNKAVPSTTINMGEGEHIRPDTARARAEQLMYTAFGVEAEAMLAVFLLEDLNQSPEVVDRIIQEFRDIRGAVTLWPSEQGDRAD
jgi:hypothetical protein